MLLWGPSGSRKRVSDPHSFTQLFAAVTSTCKDKHISTRACAYQFFSLTSFALSHVWKRVDIKCKNRFSRFLGSSPKAGAQRAHNKQRRAQRAVRGNGHFPSQLCSNAPDGFKVGVFRAAGSEPIAMAQTACETYTLLGTWDVNRGPCETADDPCQPKKRFGLAYL